jgi:UDP-N-acetylglucosamine--N-acetylmuramyl-(pentapeptide) pyrophosphoryl-undecaprenol N-acetylglucosamine transferase
MKNRPLNIVISGGGTGGHIFPALSIANELRRRYPDVKILFVGATGRMEMEKVPANGYEIIGLPVIGLPRKPGLQLIRFLIRLWQSNKKAKKIIADFKPDVAVGVGGYASGPLLRAAIKAGVPSLIQEQNSYAGITNKLLSKKVDRICVAYEHMEKFFPEKKIVLTGNPVRENLSSANTDSKEAFSFFGIDPQKKVILIIGGSLGARSINDAVLSNLWQIRESGIQVVWQTGSLYFERIKGELGSNKPENLQVHMFITRMDFAYAIADLVISRAGAGTISELCVAGKASILIPSPNVAEDHQTKNARALADKGAAILIPDAGIGSNLFTEAFKLVNDNEKLVQISTECRKLAKPDATRIIVDQIEQLIR